jgi:hypothetical protein
MNLKVQLSKVSTTIINHATIDATLPKVALLEEFNIHAPADLQPETFVNFTTKSIKEYQHELATFLGKYGSRARDLSVAKV